MGAKAEITPIAVHVGEMPQSPDSAFNNRTTAAEGSRPRYGLTFESAAPDCPEISHEFWFLSPCRWLLQRLRTTTPMGAVLRVQQGSDFGFIAWHGPQER